MKTFSIIPRWITSMAVGLFTALNAHADFIVAPNDRATQSGNNFSGSGFQTRGDFQIAYTANNFQGPVRIDGIAFRAEEGSLGSSLAAAIPRVTIRLSTYSGSVASFDPSRYSSNQGLDDTLVYDAAVNWTTTDLSGASPNPFDLKIRFSQPFIYDPSRGALLMSYVVPEAFGNVRVDFHGHGDPSIGWYGSIGFPNSLIFADLVTQFDVTPIPEPTSSVYLASALILLTVARVRK